MKKLSKIKAFTIVEILVVAAIIAALFVMAIASYAPQARKARDAKRKTDLYTIAKVLEEYEKDNEVYPAALTQCGVTTSGSPLEGYISQVPCDPQTDANYTYEVGPTALNRIWFRVYSVLENTGDEDIGRLGCTTGCGPGGAYNYYVFSPNSPNLAMGGVVPSPLPLPTGGGPTPTLPPGVTATPTTSPTATPPPSSSDLTYVGSTFYLGAVETTRFGLRAANALESDSVTQVLINNLDLMKAHGIQFVNVSLQGAKTGTANAFNSDGSLRPAYTNRLTSILNALKARDMVGVVTYFYQARDQDLANDQAARDATANATLFLIPWRNVWLYTINEYFHSGYDLTIFTTSAGRQEIYNIVKANDSSRITYVDPSFNDGFEARTGTTVTSGNVITEYIRRDDYTDPGVFTDSERTTSMNDAEITFNNGGYWFWHAAWHQKADAAGYPRFDKGGGGTSSSDRGVSFIWDKMADLTFP